MSKNPLPPWMRIVSLIMAGLIGHALATVHMSDTMWIIGAVLFSLEVGMAV